MYQTEFTEGKKSRQPNFIDFLFIYEKPYYKIEMRPHGTAIVKKLESLLPKYKSQREIKLENNFIQVEIVMHEIYLIESVKLIWKDVDTVVIFD